jgi:TRAP-type C4-dicarboxylate transport system permease small subunit
MGLKKGIDLLNRLNRPLIAAIKFIALWVLAGMMFLTFIDVLLRYIFNRYIFKSPVILGAPELIEFMMGITVTFSVVYCAYKKSHIGVDLVIAKFPDRTRKWLDCITSFITLILFLLITWQAFVYIGDEYGSRLTSAVLYIPVYPFIATAAVAFLVLCLVLLADFLSHLSEVTTLWTR